MCLFYLAYEVLEITKEITEFSLIESISTSSQFRVSNNFAQANENNYASFLRIFLSGGQRIIYLAVSEGL